MDIIDELKSYKVFDTYDVWKGYSDPDIWDYPLEEYDHCLENEIQVDIYVFNDCIRLVERR